MTPLEAVCRALRDSEPGMEKKDWRYWLTSARHALAALADQELPDTILEEGLIAHVNENPKGEFGSAYIEALKIQAAFREMLRSIANEGKTDG